MKVVVGYRGRQDGTAALLLASVLQRTTAAQLTVVAVLPRVSTAGEDRIDREYANWLDSLSRQAKQDAAAILCPDDWSALDFRRVSGTSVAAGLAMAASQEEADVLVLGCARDAAEGNFLVGSTGDRLLHSSAVPLLFAPHGYSADLSVQFSSLSCAYAGTDSSREALRLSCTIARRYGLALRVVTFVPTDAVSAGPPYENEPDDIEDTHDAELAIAMHSDALRFCRENDVPDAFAVVARGRGWSEALTALDCSPSELLVFGSSRQGQIARAFLGSTASKIMRHSPAPVLVVPQA